MNNLNRKNKKGFTLIEMVAVVAIIGILAAILVPKVTGYMKEAKKTGVIDQARKVTQAYETAVMKGKIKEKDSNNVDTATLIFTDNITDDTMLGLLDDSTATPYKKTLEKIQGVKADGTTAGANKVSIALCEEIVNGKEFNVTNDGKLIIP